MSLSVLIPEIQIPIQKQDVKMTIIILNQILMILGILNIEIFDNSD